MFFNLIILLLVGLTPPNSASLISYTIDNKSSLTLSGSSNINRFECTNFDSFSNGYVLVDNDISKQQISFSNATLHLKIRSFDCKNPLLNRDFYNTLNASESPYIDVELLNAFPVPDIASGNISSGKFNANVAITLNKKCRYDEIMVTWEKIDGNTYRFIGTKELRMSDFEIVAPVTALGLIRVSNDILIHFDLYIQSSGSTNK